MIINVTLITIYIRFTKTFNFIFYLIEKDEFNFEPN